MSKGTKNYFRHSIFMHQNDSIVQLIETGGIAHYGRYCVMIELMAAQEITNNVQGEYFFHPKTLRERLSLNEQSLNNWLTLVQQVLSIRVTVAPQSIKLSYPNVLEYLGSYNSSSPNKRKENKINNNSDFKNTDTSGHEIKKVAKILPEISEKDFDELWARYPRRDGRKAALKHFKASVEDSESLRSISIALDNYIANISHCGVETRFIKQGSTWFNNWEDWKEKMIYEDAETRMRKSMLELIPEGWDLPEIKEN